jgi:hypothetical protein
LERIWKEMVVRIRDIPEFPGKTGENHEELSAGIGGAPAEIKTEEFQNINAFSNQQATMATVD